MKVLIVGAGPTGLTAAVELGRHGIVADVIDKKAEASTFSRAVGILPRSLNILEPSGVTDQLLEEGIKLEGVQGYFGTKSVLQIPILKSPPKSAQRKHHYIIALAQDRTEDAMRDAFARYGGTVQFGTAFQSLQQNADGVIVQLSDGTERTYDYLIGADGTRSRVREAVGMDFPGKTLPERWSIADVDALNWPHPKCMTLCLLNRGRIVVIAPLEPERFRVISNTENALETLPLKMEITEVREEGSFHIGIRQVKQYSQGRVYLAGDAAHCHSPAGGRGMNLGIADAADLAARLVENRLEGYSEARHAVGAATIKFSERLRKLMTGSSIFMRAFRRTAFPIINTFPLLQRAFVRRILAD